MYGSNFRGPKTNSRDVELNFEMFRCSQKQLILPLELSECLVFYLGEGSKLILEVVELIVSCLDDLK